MSEPQVPLRIARLRQRLNQLGAPNHQAGPTLCGAMRYAQPALSSDIKMQMGLGSDRSDESANLWRGSAASAAKSTQTPPSAVRSATSTTILPDPTTEQFFDHSSAPRVNSDARITASLRKQFPNFHLVVAPAYKCNLLGYAAAGHATITRLTDDSNVPSSLQWTQYYPPARRLDGDKGILAESVIFGKFLYKWSGVEFLVYLVDGRDGMGAYPTVQNNYILSAQPGQADGLVLAAGAWGEDLHQEVWVYDASHWFKSSELYWSAQKSTWENVILDEEMKKAIIDDHTSFFDSRSTYADLKVPWKRGIIYHGPPGNGKTISIKATMHMLADRDPSIPTLYVRSLVSFMGPEYSIQVIFQKAREFAPCYLVLEDIDTIITDEVRSYFLNEVDGLKANDGIFIIASTNHLDQLDPGISKRPSRFDRKYYFPDPDVDQREAYCRFWQAKLKDNEEVEFPDKLCRAVAEITHGFSFAYIQEAFVAALLAMARRSNPDGKGLSSDDDRDSWVVVDEDEAAMGNKDDDDDLEKLPLWLEIKKQVEILREGMDDGNGDG